MPLWKERKRGGTKTTADRVAKLNKIKSFV
jgi:hypothetical protein